MRFRSPKSQLFACKQLKSHFFVACSLLRASRRAKAGLKVRPGQNSPHENNFNMSSPSVQVPLIRSEDLSCLLISFCGSWDNSDSLNVWFAWTAPDPPPPPFLLLEKDGWTGREGWSDGVQTGFHYAFQLPRCFSSLGSQVGWSFPDTFFFDHAWCQQFQLCVVLFFFWLFMAFHPCSGTFWGSNVIYAAYGLLTMKLHCLTVSTSKRFHLLLSFPL